MLSNIGINRITGVLLIAFIPAIILSTFTIDSVDTYDREFHEAFQEIADGPTHFRIGLASTMVVGLLSLVLAGALYLTLSPHHKALALFGALGFLGTGGLWAVAGVSGIALDQMAEEFDKAIVVAQATQATRTADGARPLAFIIEAAFFPALVIMLPVTLIAFGTLFVRTGAVPRWQGWLVVASSLIMAASVPLSSLIDFFWLVAMIAAMVTLLWFAFTGGWLLIWGTRDAAQQPSPSSAPVGELQPAL